MSKYVQPLPMKAATIPLISNVLERISNQIEYCIDEFKGICADDTTSTDRIKTARMLVSNCKRLNGLMADFNAVEKAIRVIERW